MQRVLGQLRRSHEGAVVPRILFTKGGGQWLEWLAASGADAVGVDWTTDLGAARARVGEQVALQGNLDPAVLLGSAEAIRNEVQNTLASYGKGAGHVFNLGHGVSRYTDPERVFALVEAVHELSRPYH
jgi:uroporphyrinogen decarboxylase